MGLADVWSRTLVYFGIAEEDDDWDEDGYATNERLERNYRDRPNVRRLAPRRSGRELEDWTEPAQPAAMERASLPRPATRLRSVEAAPPAVQAPPARVHLVVPRSFNDAQQLADRYKQGMPVILNLQGSDPELSKRLIDFASGLSYARDGGMQRVADRVFLLTPPNVEVSAEERARVLERSGFFNQA